MPSWRNVGQQLTELVTSRQPAGPRGPNPNLTPTVQQLVDPIRPYLPGVANYGASELPKPGQTNSNIPPRVDFVQVARIPVGGKKTPASLGTSGAKYRATGLGHSTPMGGK